VQKASKYRIYPSQAQITKLERTLDLCRELYNAALQERRDAYKRCGVSIGYQDQQNQLPQIKAIRPDLKAVHAQVLQDALRRLDKAFDAFFRRVKTGDNPGYPRFRSRARYDSFTYAQSGFGLEGDKLRLSKIGGVKIKLHRPIEGTIKTLTIKRSLTGKWYASFSCEVEANPLPESTEVVGIDMGLASLAHFSTDTPIENPRFFRSEEKALAKAQRELSATPKGTPERRRRRQAVARVHERIGFKRDNFSHQESRKIVNQFGIICVEGLAVSRMMLDPGYAKGIGDAAWSGFFAHLSHKAAEAGRVFLAIDPAYTTQDCSRCGNHQEMPVRVRVYRCPCCHLVIHRDLNAAINIERLGLQSLGLVPRSRLVYGAE
jgi:putative transposase